MRRLVLALAIFAVASPAFGDTRTIFTRTAFDAAYVNVTGDAMTGALTVVGLTATFTGSYAALLQRDDATTNNLQGVLSVDRSTTGTPANGLGGFIRFRIEDSAGNLNEFGRLSVAADDVTDGSEDALFRVSLTVGGTANTTVFTADGTAISPGVDIARSLGTSALRWSDAYVARSIQGALQKTLVDSVATEFVQVSVASGAVVGGLVHYTIEASDAADFQARTGTVPFTAVNKAGTETCTIDAADGDEVVAVSAGTLTNAFTCTTTPTNGILLLANANPSLVATTLRINYRVTITSGTATVTAQ